MAIRPWLSIAHHVPGRIRLRFSGSAISRLGADRLLGFADKAKEAGAIRSFRVNPVGRSLTIEYDPTAVSPALWTLFMSENDEQAAVLAARLASRLTSRSAGATNDLGEAPLQEEGMS